MKIQGSTKPPKKRCATKGELLYRQRQVERGKKTATPNHYFTKQSKRYKEKRQAKKSVSITKSGLVEKGRRSHQKIIRKWEKEN